MKKVLCLLLAICLIFMLVGCGSSYDEAEKRSDEFAKGYFTTIKEWGGGTGIDYRLIYANDTKVIYFYMDSGYGKAITPIYNADGTLQLYEE